jgi:pseudouridine-5'-phosphate glycosidase
MPYPANLDTALSLEKIIRETSSNSVVPVTIALLQGRVHIGLTRGEMERLADPEVSKKSIKVSRRDLAFGVSNRLDGGTTVAGTMLLSHQVGIETFVTGGIGGVHRGAQSSELPYRRCRTRKRQLIDDICCVVGMDISADLQELSKTPMGVVCAGAKSILDLGLTLEVLVSFNSQ